MDAPYPTYQPDVQPIHPSNASTSTLANAFAMSAPMNAPAPADDSDMGQDVDVAGVVADATVLQASEGDDVLTMSMMEDAYGAEEGDGEGLEPEVMMEEYAATEEDIEDGTMADAEEALDASESDAQHENDAYDAQTAEVADSSEAATESAEIHSYEEQLSEPKAPTEGEEQQPANIVASTASTDAPGVPEEIVSEQAQLQEPQAVASVETSAAEVTTLARDQDVQAAAPEAADPIEEAEGAEAAPEAAETYQADASQIERAEENSAAEGSVDNVRSAAHEAKVASEAQTSAADRSTEAQDTTEAAADGEQPHPVRVTFNGQDFVLFCHDEAAAYLAAEDSRVDEQGASSSRSSTVKTISAPQLAASPDVYYKPLDALFDALRVQDSLGDFLDEGTEMRFNFVDLQMEVREDDVYAREVTLDDIWRLHDGLGNPGSLHVIVQEGKRFISRYNELATHVASLIEGAASDEGDESVAGPEGGLSHGDASQQAAVLPGRHAEHDFEVDEAAVTSDVRVQDQPLPTEDNETKAKDTLASKAEASAGESAANAEQEHVGSAEPVAAGDDEDEYEDAGEEEYEPYDETQYDNANEEQPEEADATQYEPAEEQDEEGNASHYQPAEQQHEAGDTTKYELAEEHGEDEEPIVDYNEAYEQAVDAPNGHTADEGDATEEYVDVKSPTSNKRSLDASYEEDEHGVYSEAEGVQADATSEQKRARYEAGEA